MKQSLRTRLIIIFTGMILFTIVLIWCMNRFLLSSFYEDSKIDQMDNVYEKIESTVKDVKWDALSEAKTDQIYDKLEGISQNSGVSVYVIRLVYSLGGWNTNYVYPAMRTPQTNDIQVQFTTYVKAQFTGEKLVGDYKLLYSNDDYDMYRVFDNRIGSNYIELAKNVNGETWVYLRTNYQSVEEGASVSNRLLTYVGLFATIVGIIVMFFVSNWYTKPILRLAKHARKMSELDFDIRYDENRVDEIGVLGDSMNRLSDKLEETISELKTANNELQLDIVRKQEKEDMRTEFLANVSHELKTPIALIQGYAEGLQDNINDDDESREFYCEVIVDEANKMNTMVKKLLDLNQLEFGQDQVHVSRFDLTELLQGAAAKEALRAGQKDATIHVPELENVHVWADEYMIDEVITNYLTNAINHVDGDKVIEIKMEKKQDIVRVSVFNSGLPIPDEDLNKIWDKFYKVDKARTREYGGNGIGLSIVKAIMEAHNQQFGVTNHSDGVEFWFELEIENVD